MFNIHKNFHDNEKMNHDGNEKKTHEDHMGDDKLGVVSRNLYTFSYTASSYAFHSDDTFSYADTYDVTF